MNERGFLMLSATFLTLIVSLAAMIYLNGNVKVQQRNSTLYLTAINLANEQFAMLESLAANNNLYPADHVKSEDKISYNGIKRTNTPIYFTISTNISDIDIYNFRTATVTVTWNVKDKVYSIESEKFIRVSGD